MSTHDQPTIDLDGFFGARSYGVGHALGGRRGRCAVISSLGDVELTVREVLLEPALDDLGAQTLLNE